MGPWAGPAGARLHLTAAVGPASAFMWQTIHRPPIPPIHGPTSQLHMNGFTKQAMSDPTPPPHLTPPRHHTHR